MVYTLGVRLSVCRRILNEKLGVDDDAFEELIGQELANRKVAEEKAQQEAQAKARREAAEKAVVELAGGPEISDEGTETLEFGGDYESGVEEETADQVDTGEDGDGRGTGEPD